MTLPLITPIGSNFVKDWPSQNGINCDLFDAAAGPCLTTHPLKTYTPVWTASTTDPVVGTGGVQIGYYYQVFDMIYVYSEMRLGTSGALRGSGTYTMSLPVKAKTLTFGTGAVIIGNAQAYSNATPAQRQPLVTVLPSSFGMIVQFFCKIGGATSKLVTETVPFTFNSLDGIMWSARYQRDLS